MASSRSERFRRGDDDPGLDIPEDPTEAAAWLDEHMGELSEAELQEAQNYFEDQALTQGQNDMYVGQAWGELASAASTARVEGPEPGYDVLSSATAGAEGAVNIVGKEEEGAAIDAERERWNASIDSAGEFGGNFIVESQGTPAAGGLQAALETEMPDDLSASDREKWLREAETAAHDHAVDQIAQQNQAAGQSEGAARQTAEQQVAATTSITATPQWMLEDARGIGYTFTAENDYGVSPELQQRFLDYYNAQYGTSIDDFDALTSDMQEPVDEVRSIWQAALLGDEPTLSRSVEIPGMEAVSLTQDEIDILAGNYGLSSDGINRMVRLAYMNRGVDANGDPRPVDLYALAAAARGMGMSSGLADQERRDREIRQLEAEIDRVREADWGPDVSGQQSRIQELERQLNGMRRMNTPTSGGGPQAPGIYGIRNNLYTGLERYNNNQTLAVLHVLDPGLAARIAATGGDLEKLDQRDSARAYDLLIDAGVVDRQKNGFRPDSAILAEMASYFGIGAGAGRGGGRVRRVIDSIAVKQSVDQLWQSMFRAEAPPDLVAQFTKNLQAQLDKAPEGQDFDISARVDEFLHGQSQYTKMYGKKPEGTTDQEWQAQFVSGQQSILGAEIPTGADPIALGMESGSYQTAVGAAAGTKQAWDNSTWMGRLAQAAQSVAENT